jgi:hypothetical protein
MSAETVPPQADEKILVTIHQMADEACRDNAFAVAEKKLVTSIMSDKRLTRVAVTAFAHDEIQFSIQKRRQHITAAARDEPPTSTSKQQARIYAKDVTERISRWSGQYLSWPLSTRVLLGDATLNEVTAEAEMYDAQSAGNARNARFMRLVAARLKKSGADIVKKCLTDSQLAVLMSRAKEA